jgi:hypothetical protein
MQQSEQAARWSFAMAALRQLADIDGKCGMAEKAY